MRWASVVLLAAVGMSSVAAPVPKQPAPDYFPTLLGSKWEYAKDGEKEVVMTVEVTKVTAKDGVRTVEVTTTTINPKGQDAKVVSKSVLRVDGDGVAMATGEGEEISPPRLDLRAKPKEDDKWACPHEWKNRRYAYETTVGKEEKVEVPVGKFTALPHTQWFGEGDIEYNPRTTWYAPGVGAVKRVTEDKITLVLVKYTAGK